MSIEVLLPQIVELLEAHDEAEWTNGFRQFLLDYPNDPMEVKRRIRRVYGGMGSFNDLVLHSQDKHLQAENNELDRMRAMLYSLCQNES